MPGSWVWFRSVSSKTQPGRMGLPYSIRIIRPPLVHTAWGRGGGGELLSTLPGIGAGGVVSAAGERGAPQQVGEHPRCGNNSQDTVMTALILTQLGIGDLFIPQIFFFYMLSSDFWFHVHCINRYRRYTSMLFTKLVIKGFWVVVLLYTLIYSYTRNMRNIFVDIITGRKAESEFGF